MALAKSIGFLVAAVAGCSLANADAAKIFKASKDAIVTVVTSRSQGTAFFTGDGTLAVTAAHVIEDSPASEIRFSVPNVRVASIYAIDPQKDIAILKLNRAVTKKLALAPSVPTPGSRVYVIGTPEGLQHSISEGLVSGIRKTSSVSLLQISAAISHGSSGGPVIDLTGKVVGLVQGSLESGQSLNFAVAASEIRLLMSTKRKVAPVPVARIEKLIAQLGEPNDQKVNEARYAIRAIGSRAVPALIEALESRDARIQREVAYELGQILDRRAVPALIEALSNPDRDVRDSAIYALGVLGDKRAVEPLLSMGELGKGLESSIAEALGMLGDKRAAQPIVSLLKSSNSSTRMDAAAALGKLGDKGAIRPLMEFLESNEDFDLARAEALRSLGMLKAYEAVDLIVKFLSDPDGEWVRPFAARALTMLADPKALEPLLKCIEDSSEEMRIHVAKALGTIKDSRAVEALKKMAKDPSMNVRRSAQKELDRINGKGTSQPESNALE